MKWLIGLVVSIVVLVSSAAWAGDVGVDLNIHLGDRPSFGVPVPAYAAPPVVIQQPPLFLYPPGLGFYVAAGVPYDLFLISNSYYLNRGGAWYVAPHYGGPWAVVPYGRVPPPLRRYGIPMIHEYRDREYRIYRAGNYRGRYFLPDRAWREHRKVEHDAWKEHRKDEHDAWKHYQKQEHDARKDVRRTDQNAHKNFHKTVNDPPKDYRKTDPKRGQENKGHHGDQHPHDGQPYGGVFH
jgi:hypothetical protein